jgi:hypothetical protein
MSKRRTRSNSQGLWHGVPLFMRWYNRGEGCGIPGPNIPVVLESFGVSRELCRPFALDNELDDLFHFTKARVHDSSTELPQIEIHAWVNSPSTI